MKDLKKNRFLLGPVLVILGVLGLTMSSSDEPPIQNDVVNIDELIKKVLELNEKKEHQKAIDLLLKSVEDQKQDPLLKALLAQTFDLFLADEIQRGQEQIKKNRKDQNAYLSVSKALELMGDDFRAMEILLNGIAQAPSPDLWMKIAGLELKAGRDLEALDVYLEVTRLDSHNALALNNAAFIMASTTKSKDDDDLDEAEKLAKKAMKIEPNNPQYMDTLAEVYFRKGEQVSAQNLIKEAIKLAPDNEKFKNRLYSFESGSKNLFIAK